MKHLSGAGGHEPGRGPWRVAIAAALLVWAAPALATEFDPNTDRRDVNDTIFDMQRPTPQLCLDRCLNDRACRSWTFTKEADGTATCSIGNTVRQPKLYTPCCTSGTR